MSIEDAIETLQQLGEEFAGTTSHPRAHRGRAPGSGRSAQARRGLEGHQARARGDRQVTTNPTRRATNMATKKTNGHERAVVVTTEHRGVFFGYAKDTDGETIKLNRARLCVYWSADVKGFMGLASGGPTASCKIGPAATITLRKITSVLEATPAAVDAWESAPWR